MKKFKLLALMAMLVFGSAFFTACDLEDDPITPGDKPKPAAPSNLRGTSQNATTVLLRWDKSIHEDSTWFKGYELTITGGAAMAPRAVGKTQPFAVTGLEEGVIYTFTLKAANTDGVTSDGSTSVQWSPASRFETTDIRMYSFSSQNGSGLSLFDATANKPVNLRASEKTRWHLGLDDRTTGALFFGPASLIDIGTGTPVDEVEIADDFWDANSLDILFEKTALNTLNFVKTRVNLLQVDNNTTGVVFVVRVKRQGQTQWNYAKVLVERGSGGFLQGTGNDKYVQMKISYQKSVDVPYAKISE